MSTTGTHTSIPFLDLSRQHREVEAEIIAAISKVISRSTFVLGNEVSCFEAEWAAYCGTLGCAAVANGTDAICLSLLASGVVTPGNGDEVITSSISAGYTALAILQAGAVPVFVDVDRETLLVDPASVERSITQLTKAIVPVHLYGQICDIDAISAIALRHGLSVIEDAAQAHGAWRNEPSGFDRIGAFSFYPTKNLGACGDGGAVVSNDMEFIQRIKCLRQGGHQAALAQPITGRNSRLDEIQAAVLRIKLGRLDEWNQGRSRLADNYDQILLSLEGVEPLKRNPRDRHADHLYVVKTRRRNELRAFLQNRSIETAVHYPVPLNHEPLFMLEGRAAADITVADEVSSQILSLPLNSHSFDWEIEAVAQAILEFERQ